MAEINNNQKPTKKYKFGSSEIDLGHYIRNLDSNVQSYLDSKSWNDGQKDEFVKAYQTYISGLQEQLNSNTDRFSTTSTGGIVDNSGILGNIDDDDIDPVGSQYYYDNKEIVLLLMIIIL